MNWAPYAVYNPQLWHFPEDWPLVRLSPTVEPFIVIGYSTFYFIAPFFASTWILRRLQARASADSFVWRRPLVSLAALIFVTGFVIDAALEIFLVRTGLYIYSQVMPWGSLFAGTTFQFPLIWESALVTVVMIPAGVLCYRDDTGRTQAEKLAQRLRWFPQPPGARHVPGDVRDPERRLLHVRRRLRRDPRVEARDLRRLPVAVPGSQGLRPAGLLRERGAARPVLRGALERLDDRSAERASDREPGEGRWVLQARPCAEPRSVVITGASRGLGLASATHLYELGWRVVGAMRSPDAGLERLRAATGAAADDPPPDRRPTRPRRPVVDRSPPPRPSRRRSVRPTSLVHNAGIAAVGCVEDMPFEAWERLFRTNLFGPVRLTKELLPSMRAAGRGRIVVVSSQGGIRGMPSISAYSASKGALERWAESLAEEIAPFGLGVTDPGLRNVQDGHPHRADASLWGPERAVRRDTTRASIARVALRWTAWRTRPNASLRRSPGFSTSALRSPGTRWASTRACCCFGSRLLPGRLLHHLIRRAMGLPRHGELQPPNPRRVRIEMTQRLQGPLRVEDADRRQARRRRGRHVHQHQPGHRGGARRGRGRVEGGHAPGDRRRTPRLRRDRLVDQPRASASAASSSCRRRWKPRRRRCARS